MQSQSQLSQPSQPPPLGTQPSQQLIETDGRVVANVVQYVHREPTLLHSRRDGRAASILLQESYRTTRVCMTSEEEWTGFFELLSSTDHVEEGIGVVQLPDFASPFRFFVRVTSLPLDTTAFGFAKRV